MREEIQFEKYIKKGADYHYRQTDKWNFSGFNPYVLARYEKHVNIVLNYVGIVNKNGSNPLRVVDFGCGDGVLLHKLAKRLGSTHFEYYGIDLSKEALEIAKQRLPRASFGQMGVYDSGFENSFFDIVISSDVIEHVNFPNKMVEEMHRVSKDNAIIIIGTPIKYTMKPMDLMHFQEFYPEEFRCLMGTKYSPIDLIESHNLIDYAKYISSRPSRFWFKMKTCLEHNPFMAQRKNSSELFTYMFYIGQKNG